MNCLLTKKEVAKKLCVCERTIDNLRKNQGLPYANVGGQIRFTEAAIDHWLQRQSVIDLCGTSSENDQISRN